MSTPSENVQTDVDRFFDAFHARDYETAAERIATLCNSSPDNSEYAALRGAVFVRMGRYCEAHDVLMEVHSRDRGNITALTHLSLIESASPDPALRQLRLALKHARQAFAYSAAHHHDFTLSARCMLLIAIALLNHANYRLARRYAKLSRNLQKESSVKALVGLICKKARIKTVILIPEIYSMPSVPGSL